MSVHRIVNHKKQPLLGLTLATWMVIPSTQASDTLTQDVSVNVNNVAQMAITGLGIPAFIVGTANTPGGSPSVIKDPYDRYLQYTSIVPNGETRAIQAQLTNAAPTGMGIRLSTNATNGTGAVGVAQYTSPGASAALLSTTPVDMVTGIGTGYTGDGATDGLLLNYEFLMTSDLDQIKSGSYVMEVTFTLAAMP